MPDSSTHTKTPAPDGMLANGRVKSDNLRPAKLDPNRPFPTGRGVLSSAEIEALLRPDLPDPGPAPKSTTPRPIADLDAATSQSVISENDADRLCARLTLSTHRATGLAIAMTRLETQCGLFRSAFPTPETGSAHACYGTPDGEVTAILTLSATAASALIDMSCGASGATLASAPPRALTEIDTAVLQRALSALAAHLPGGTLHCIETRPAFTHSIAPPGPATSLVLNVQLDTISASARLIVSDEAWTTQPSTHQAHKTAAPSAVPSQAQDKLTALLTARIATLSVPVSRVANLKPGDTLLLGLPADEPVQLLSGGRNGAVAAEGQMGRKGKRMAVRITKRGAALRP